MAALAPSSRLTHAIIEAGLVLVSVILGLIGLPWLALAAPVTAALGWWLWRHHAQLRTMASSRPGQLLLLGPVSVGLIVLVHAAAFWVARSVHGAL